VRPCLRHLERAVRYEVYFILQGNEPGWTYRPGRLPVSQPDASKHPLLHKHRSRYRFYYFYLRDEVLGPLVLRRGTFSTSACADPSPAATSSTVPKNPSTPRQPARSRLSQGRPRPRRNPQNPSSSLR